MRSGRLLTWSILVCTSILHGTTAQALTLDVGVGWVFDRVDDIGGPSEGSPVTFTLARSGVFSLTDGYNPGDVYTVTGDVSGHSTLDLPSVPVPLGRGDTYFDPLFSDTTYSHFQTELAPGTYTISIRGDGAGGIPAGFAYRADLLAVPLPGSAPLFGAALVTVALARRRRGAETDIPRVI